jgi:geranylgeranyl reductase family protein
MPALSESESYDVLIVGMGPAGAVAACTLSQAGVSVLGLDKQTHPRYKVCGGGLSARIEHILGSEFKSVIEHTVHSVLLTYGGKDPILIESSEPFAYMVMRDRFDHILLEKARRAGAQVRQSEQAVNVVESTDGVEVITDRGRYRTKVLIGADGANSVVAQCLFPERRLRRMPTLESEVHIGRSPLYPGEGKALIDIGATRKGYAWIFPKKERLSIGLGGFDGRMSNPKRIFQRFIRDEPGMSHLNVPTPLGHPLPVYSASGSGTEIAQSLVKPRAVLVGDAGHFVDPLFGEGIYYAVRSGQMAADSILTFFKDTRRGLMDYQYAVSSEIYPEFHVAARIADIVYTFPRLCHRLTSRYQDVMRLYFDVLRGRETYQTFLLKAKRLLKASFHDLVKEAIPFG